MRKKCHESEHEMHPRHHKKERHHETDKHRERERHYAEERHKSHERVGPKSTPEKQKRHEQMTNPARKSGLKKSEGELAVPYSLGYSHRKGMSEGGRADEGHWIQKAIRHPGALHKKLGVPEGHKIPEKKLMRAEHSANPKTRRQARLAETLKGLHKR